MKTKPTLRSLLVIASSSLLAISQSHAADGTWIQTGAGPFDWSTAATGNWSGGTVADGADSTANFTANITAAQTVNLAEARTIGNITFTDSTTDSHNLTISGANLLTMDRSSGTPVINVTQAARTLTISSPIAGNDGLQKSGPGTLSLSADNPYSGATTIQGGNNFSLISNLLSNVAAGSITLSGSGAINSTTALNLSDGGTLRLVNTAQADRFADAAAISVTSGGGISYENTSGANTYTETVGAVTLTSGQFNVNLATNQAGAGSQTLTINTGGITRTGSTNTSAITFSAATTGPEITGNKNMIFVTGGGTTAANEIIGPWATTGTATNAQTDYAVYDGDYVKPLGATPSTDDTGWTTSWANTSNYAWGNGATGMTVTTTKNINTLRHTGGAETLTLNGANLGSYGILNGGSGMLTVSRSGTSEVVTLPTTSAGQLHVTTGSQSVTINAPVADNTGALTLVKSGSGGTLAMSNYETNGTLVLNGVNTYTGDTIINAGTLRVGTNNTANGAKLGGTSGDYGGNIFIGSGAMLHISTDANQILSGNISGEGALVKTYGGKLTLSGNNTYTGKTSITPTTTSGAGTLEVYSFNSVNGGTPLLASSSLGAPTTIANGTIDLGGPKSIQGGTILRYIGTDVGGETTDRVINITFGSSTSRSLDASGTGLLKFTSAFTSAGTINASSKVVLTGTGSGQIDANYNLTAPFLSKQGTGTWTLAGAGNTFAGTIVLETTGTSAGTLSYASAAGTNPIQFNQTFGTATLKFIGAAPLTMSGLISATALSTGVITLDASGVTSADTITYSNTTSLSTASGGANFRTIAFSGTNTGDNTFAGAIASNAGGGGVRKDGTGKWILTGTSTYAGTTDIRNGTLSVGLIQNKTVAGPMGAGQSFALGNGNTDGTLLYTGAGESTDRNVRVGGSTAGTGGGSILNNGGGALIFTGGPFNNQATGITDTRTLTLGGSYTAVVNEVQGEIRDNVAGTAKVSVEKTGDGTWKLSGANTYTGNTTVTGGTLALADNAQLKFVLGATSGSNNSISGAAGTVTLEGDFVIDTTAADALPSGTWTLENVATLPGAYGSNFTVVGFTNAGSDKWTKANGSKLYTFDETTGILTLAAGAGGYSDWAALNGGGPIDGDHDGDGVTNGVEYFIYGPVASSGFTALPPVVNTGGTLTVTWTKAAGYTGTYGTDFVVQTSATLTDPWTPVAEGVGADKVEITGNEVKFTFPSGTRNFARLKITGP